MEELHIWRMLGRLRKAMRMPARIGGWWQYELSTGGWALAYNGTAQRRIWQGMEVAPYELVITRDGMPAGRAVNGQLQVDDPEGFGAALMADITELEPAA